LNETHDAEKQRKNKKKIIGKTKKCSDGKIGIRGEMKTGK
jgi:hypothetical protein